MPAGSRSRHKEAEEWLCGQCKAKDKNIECDCCKLCLPPSSFNDSALHHKKSQDQRKLCKACQHPQCTVPDCRTCRSCRSKKCTRKNCTQPIAFNVHSSQLPQTIADRNSFKCENCQYPPCLDCRTQMPAGSRSRFAASGETHWICSECKKFPRCNCGKAMPKQRRKGFLKSNDKTYTCADCAAEQKMRSTRQRHT